MLCLFLLLLLLKLSVGFTVDMFSRLLVIVFIDIVSCVDYCCHTVDGNVETTVNRLLLYHCFLLFFVVGRCLDISINRR